MDNQSSVAAGHYSKWQVLRPVLGGMLGLAVAMGIGRFAYTPLLPVMEGKFHFSASFAGWLASWNYFGYLMGAIVAARLPGHLRYRFILLSLFGSVLTTGSMAWSESHFLWSILRVLGGFFSAGVLVLSSSLIMDLLTLNRQASKLGIFYAGVGMGIALTGVLVPVFSRFGGWRLGWLGLAIVSLLIVACAWIGMRNLQTVLRPVSPLTAENFPVENASFRLWGISVAYGMEGLCYIVMATFITVFFRHLSRMPWLADASWVLVGLAAMPSTWLWTKAAQRWGWQVAIYTAYTLQAIGVLLPVLWPGVATAILGSILFGGTFMGITTLALSIGCQCAPAHSERVIGNMTAMFGIGQVIGPVAAGAITGITHNYSLSMILSGLLLLATVALLWSSRVKYRN